MAAAKTESPTGKRGRAKSVEASPAPKKACITVADGPVASAEKTAEVLPSAALAAGMKPGDIQEFFSFLQCQVAFEAKQVLEQDVQLADPKAREMWEDYIAFVTPNLGANERWVPFHTALGVHEFFLINNVHHGKESFWDEKRRFLAIFIFRSHCKKDFFNEAQLPHMKRKDFWKNPANEFRENGPLEMAMRDYRRKTGRPLLTLAMRMIPERLLPDDDDNLVRSIVNRTQRLLEVAENIWPIIQDDKKPAGQKFMEISTLIQQAKGLGETWAKMLTVCLDLAYPKKGLLGSQCDVGIGAQGPLRGLLPNGGPEDPVKALQQLQAAVNGSSSDSSDHFWTLLPKVEDLVRKHYKDLGLIKQIVKTERGKMTAVTLQVQLCEYRQFRNSLARRHFGLKEDDSMKLPDKPKRAKAEDHVELEEGKKAFLVHFPTAEGEEAPKHPPMRLELSATGGKQKLAQRAGLMLFERMRAGASLADVEAFREDLLRQCKAVSGLPDAPESSEAWVRCKANVNVENPTVGFHHQPEKGPRIPFQTTAKAAGSFVNAERVARLCWVRLHQGQPKEAVLAFRDKQYAGLSAAPAPAAAKALKRPASAPPAKRA